MPLDGFKYTPDIEGYKAAVWDFLLEHSDITLGGKIFVKFHATDKKNFENRVLGRWKHNYHREDPKKKDAIALQRREMFAQVKREKKARWQAAKKARLAALKK